MSKSEQQCDDSETFYKSLLIATGWNTLISPQIWNSGLSYRYLAFKLFTILEREAEWNTLERIRSSQ